MNTMPLENTEPLSEALLDEAAEWLVRLNESQATQAEFEEWQRWLNADRRHARAFDALESTWQISAQAAIALHSRDEPKFTRYLPDEPVSTWVRRRHNIRRRRVWAAAAAVLILAGIVGNWWSRQPAIIQTAIAEQRVVWLPDRSRVTVGPLTRVSYRYSAATRALSLDTGQAFFEVTKDAHRPFVVDTRHGRIVAVGTAFSVDVASDRLNVTVAEGTVRIENAELPQKPTGYAVAHPIMVGAGRRYVAAKNGASVTALPSATPDVSWRDGRLAYYGDPLSAVIADLNRYAVDPIELADPRLGDLQYSGTVFPESVNDWLVSLPNIFPVRVERREHGWLILSRGDTPSTTTSAASAAASTDQHPF
jgi:transmembrane sensor